MRFSSFSFATAFLILSFTTLVSAQSGTQNMLTTNLSLGSRNAQVVVLQQILNRDPDTRIANTGPGSLGNETSYFGALTKVAVIRFQEKYANEVLTPAGLIRGNGFVGSYTRAKLNLLSAVVANVVKVNPPIVLPVTTSSTTTIPAPVIVSPPPAPVLGTASQNPNLVNIKAMLAKIDEVGTRQGISDSELAIVHKKVIERLSTTTDLRATFLKSVQSALYQAQNTSFSGRIFAIAEQLFGKVFLPEHALAATGLPFGGALLGFIPCDIGFNIMVQPLPPTFVGLLYYVEGTQAFLSYNIPATPELLGAYAPGGGACVIGWVYIPSEGTITPMVGSSPL